jgi:hypothetical protein
MNKLPIDMNQQHKHSSIEEIPKIDEDRRKDWQKFWVVALIFGAFISGITIIIATQIGFQGWESLPFIAFGAFFWGIFFFIIYRLFQDAQSTVDLEVKGVVKNKKVTKHKNKNSTTYSYSITIDGQKYKLKKHFFNQLKEGDWASLIVTKYNKEVRRVSNQAELANQSETAIETRKKVENPESIKERIAEVRDNIIGHSEQPIEVKKLPLTEEDIKKIKSSSKSFISLFPGLFFLIISSFFLLIGIVIQFILFALISGIFVIIGIVLVKNGIKKLGEHSSKTKSGFKEVFVAKVSDKIQGYDRNSNQIGTIYGNYKVSKEEFNKLSIGDPVVIQRTFPNGEVFDVYVSQK